VDLLNDFQVERPGAAESLRLICYTSELSRIFLVINRTTDSPRRLKV
jgi:hypothetical protein